MTDEAAISRPPIPPPESSFLVRGVSSHVPSKMLVKLVARLALGQGLDAKATTILSDMTPASSGDTGPDMPRPLLDCGPYANSVRPSPARRTTAQTEALVLAEGAKAQRSCGSGCSRKPGWRMRVCVCGRLGAFATTLVSSALAS